MKIEITKIRDWIQPDMDLRSAWNIVTREYCQPLTREGACPQECALCRERLKAMFNLSAARNPGALLTYLARRQRGIALEQARSHTAPDGFSDAGNPFAAILEEL